MTCERVECEVCSVECGVESVKYKGEVWCEVWSVKFGVGSVECDV